MPITSSAKKALRKDRRREAINRSYKKRLSLILKKTKTKATKKNLSLAFSTIDRVVKKKVIHANKGARLKSRLTKKLLRKS